TPRPHTVPGRARPRAPSSRTRGRALVAGPRPGDLDRRRYQGRPWWFADPRLRFAMLSHGLGSHNIAHAPPELTSQTRSIQSPPMSPTLAMTSGNPVLSAETFRTAPALARDDVMTIEGTVNKTAISLAILFVAATWVWSIGVGDPRVGGLLMLG